MKFEYYGYSILNTIILQMETSLVLGESEDIERPIYIVQQSVISRKVIKWWSSIDDILLRYSGFKKHIILRNLNNNTKSGYGFIWFYYRPPQKIYKTLTNFQDFDVSNYGDVRNNKTLEKVTKSINNNGYEYVEIYQYKTKKNPINETVLIHSLVAYTFLTNYSYDLLDNDTTVYHKDDNKTNNIIDNLTFNRPEFLSFKINQIDLETGDVIKSFDKLSEIPNVNTDHVLDACNGVCNCSGGYGWKFCYD